MYYYKLNDGRVIDVEKITHIEYSDLGRIAVDIKFVSGSCISVSIKDISTKQPIDAGLKDVENIENIMKMLTQKNVAQVYINDSSLSSTSDALLSSISNEYSSLSSISDDELLSWGIK